MAETVAKIYGVKPPRDVRLNEAGNTRVRHVRRLIVTRLPTPSLSDSSNQDGLEEEATYTHMKRLQTLKATILETVLL